MTLVKICGLTNYEDARAALDAGADYVGFIFYPKSPRCADPEAVARIMMALDDDDTPSFRSVGVFVGATGVDVKATLTQCHLAAAQIHKLTRESLDAVRKQIYGCAFAAVQPQSLPEALTTLDLVPGKTAGNAFRPPEWMPTLLLDAFSVDKFGGTGKRVDLELAQEMIARVPQLMLAGGLTPDNVGDVVSAVHPWAVDVASGVEKSPGFKDHAKLRDFIQAVKAAG